MKQLYAACFTLGLTLALMNGAKAQFNTILRAGNSYVNVTKGTVGGSVEPGDVLEIRTNIFFAGTYNGGANLFYARYVDNLPTKTSYNAGNLKLITNEGITVSSFTDVGGDDAGTYKALPSAGEYNIKINIGSGTTAPANNIPTNTTGAGTIDPGTTIPKLFGGTLITTAFRVTVTGNYGDTITLGKGTLYYKKTNSAFGADTIIYANQYKILITPSLALCPNALGANFSGESNGTFDHGTTQNRSYGPLFPIPNYQYTPLTPSTQTGDGKYALVNNLSPYASTNNGAQYQNSCSLAMPNVLACGNRMHGGFWDIIGDHTNAISPAAGNPAVATGTDGGYMLVVNADVVTSEAYNTTIASICPDTYYEFSCWIRNVCKNCGIDMNSSSTYTPGVLPNLSFNVDGLDYYTTGQVTYTGNWVKKGFIFKTRPGQTSITVSIRNNASGGGGNDWVMDDISIATCLPDLAFTPSPVYTTCAGGVVNFGVGVTSYFNNYTSYRWQKSTDNGVTYVNDGSIGTGTPVSGPGGYSYNVTHPSFVSTLADSGAIFRLVVATNSTNLSDPNCSVSNTLTNIKLDIKNCVLLAVQLTNFDGQLLGNSSHLKWETQNETKDLYYYVERSTDGLNFTTIGSVAGKYANSNGPADYSFVDPQDVTGSTFYRLKIYSQVDQNTKYSRTIVLSNNSMPFEVRSVVNPFSDNLIAEFYQPENGTVSYSLYDAFGKLIVTKQQTFNKGINNLRLDGLSKLSKGVYIFKIQYQNQFVNKRVVKE